MKINAKLEAADVANEVFQTIANTEHHAHCVDGTPIASLANVDNDGGNSVFLTYSNGQRFAVRVKALGRKAGA